MPVALLVGHGQVGVVAEVQRAPRDHPRAQRAQQHRHVGALDGGQALDVRVDEVGQAVQVRRPAGGAERRPGRERVVRRPHGAVGIGGVGARDLGEHRLVDRRDVGEALGTGHPLAADEVVGADLDAGHLADVGASQRSCTVSRSSTV